MGEDEIDEEASYHQSFDDDDEESGDDNDSDSDPYGSDDSDNKKKKSNKKKKGIKSGEIREIKPDAYLIRREATLLQLCLKSFKKRVIVFFNEKVQCHRMLILFKIYNLKAAEVHGNLTQQERMNSIEEFQRGDVDYLLATDLVARGLDIPNVKTVINFSFPNEPKRYLHRIGRTARAGMHGISVTLCNDQERTEIKKLNRKLGHPITPYTLQAKTVQRMFEQVVSMDAMVKDLLIEEAGDKELQQGLMEARRAENLIKYREEIQNRPKNVWLKNEKQK